MKPPKEIPQTFVAQKDDATKEMMLGPEHSRVYKLVPDTFQEAIDNMEITLLTRSEGYLVKHSEPKPDARDNSLRIRFWNEMYRAIDLNEKSVSYESLLRGSCSYFYFRAHFLQKPIRLAWLLSPPATTMAMIDETISVGMNRMRNFVKTAEIYNVTKTETGIGTSRKVTTKKVFNERVMKELRECVQMCWDRKEGSVIQRAAVAVNDNSRRKEDGDQAELPASREDIERRMAELNEAHEAEFEDTPAQDVPRETSSE